MIDLDNLLTACISRINSDPNTTAIANRTFFGVNTTGLTGLYCRCSILGDDPSTSYGGKVVDSVRVQFSVFARSLADANNNAKGISTAFAGVPLTLSGQINVHAVRKGGGVLTEGKDAKDVVYHAFVWIDFWIDS